LLIQIAEQDQIASIDAEVAQLQSMAAKACLGSATISYANAKIALLQSEEASIISDYNNQIFTLQAVLTGAVTACYLLPPAP
jgi:hypothetical protein